MQPTADADAPATQIPADAAAIPAQQLTTPETTAACGSS